MSKRRVRNDESRDERETKVSEVRKKNGKGSYKRRSFRGSKDRTVRTDDVSNTSGGYNDMSKGSVDPKNDPEWYNADPEQVKNVANISFLNALGTPIDLYANGGGIRNSEPLTAIPGVVRIGWVPTYGNPTEPSDAVNVATQKTYSWVRYYNSGSRNYQAPDLMKYYMAMDSIYTWAGYLTRLYSLMCSYSSVNRYLPEALMVAMNFDYDSAQTNLSIMRADINKVISKINSLAVPAIFPMFYRHFWMCANVYKDSPDVFSQAYIHVPDGIFRFNSETGDLELIALNTKPATMAISNVDNYYVDVPVHEDLNTNRMTWQQAIKLANDLINSVMATEDFGLMAGDTLKAFSGTNVFQVSPLPEDSVLYPVYDGAILNQFMNANPIGELTIVKEGTLGEPSIYGYITEDYSGNSLALCSNYTEFDERGRKITTPLEGTIFSAGYNIGAQMLRDLAAQLNVKSFIVNHVDDQVQPIDVLETTRAQAIYEYVFNNTNNTIRTRLSGCGADVYTTYSIITINKDLNDKSLFYRVVRPFGNFLFMGTGTQPDIFTSPQSVVEILHQFECFDWHPQLSVVQPTFVGTTSTIDKLRLHLPFIDYRFLALVDAYVLHNMHDVANLSLMDVTKVFKIGNAPGFGKK